MPLPYFIYAQIMGELWKAGHRPELCRLDYPQIILIRDAKNNLYTRLIIVRRRLTEKYFYIYIQAHSYSSTYAVSLSNFILHILPFVFMQFILSKDILYNIIVTCKYAVSLICS